MGKPKLTQEEIKELKMKKADILKNHKVVRK